MVHPNSFLDDGDLASSPPSRDVEEEDDYGKYSDAESEPEQGYGQDGEEADGEEEVTPTLRDWGDDLLNISVTEPTRSKANPSGSGDPASRK